MQHANLEKTYMDVKYDIIEIPQWFFKPELELTTILMKKYKGTQNPALIKELVDKVLKECEKADKDIFKK